MTHTHVGHEKRVVQDLVARDHRAHQHIGTAAGVFGQGLHGNVHAQIECLEGDACAPGVVQRGQDGAAARDAGTVCLLVGSCLVGLLHNLHQRGQIGIFQGD